MHTPKISIIVPIYNAEATLSRCVESLLCQTFQDFEIILIDDCSKDQSRTIIKQYENQDKRIKSLFATKNGGSSATRNLGLDIARGEFVMFADSDDFATSDWIEQLYHAQTTNPNVLVMANIFDIKGGENIPRMHNYKDNCIVEMDYFKLFSVLHLDGYLFNKFFDRQIIEKNDLRFNISLKGGEDVDFIFRYIKYQEYSKFFLIEKPLYYYWRDNEQSITNHYSPNILQDNLHCFECRLPYISKDNLANFCDSYFSYLYGMFDVVFDKRSQMSFWQAMAYNHQIVTSPSFRICVKYSKQSKSNTPLMYVIRTYNYYLIWTFQRLLKIIDNILYHFHS